MGSAIAETQMSVGVHLRTQVIDPSGSPSAVVQTDGSLRATAVNLGVISFQAQLSTQVLGGSVTNHRHSDSWETTLLIAGSTGAKTSDQADTKLIVTEPGGNVAFRTVARLEQLTPFAHSYHRHYVSDPLDIIAKTA